MSNGELSLCEMHA